MLTNGPEGRARRAIEELEAFRAALGELLGGQIAEQPTPIRVLLFERVWDFAPYKLLDADGRPQSYDGQFVGRGDVNYFAISGELDDFVPRIVLHEYTHLLVAKLLGRPPTWLNEGLAEYFSAFRYVARERRAEIGRPISTHLQYLNDAVHLPLAQLLETTYDSPAFASEVTRWTFYARSWLLVHYLQVGSDKRAGALSRFMQLRGEGLDDAAALEKAAGCTLAELETELVAYQRKSLQRFGTVTLGREPLGTPIAVRPAPTADALYRLGEFLLALSPDRRADAQAHFAAAGRPEPAAPALAADFVPPPPPGTPPAGTARPAAERQDERTLGALRAAAASGSADLATSAAFVRRLQEAAASGDAAIAADLPLARRALTATILETPANESLWHLLNWLYAAVLEPGEYEHAVAVYEQGVARAPRSYAAPYGLAKLHAAAGDPARAKAVIVGAVARLAREDADRFDTLLVELDATEASRLAERGEAAAGLALLEARLAATSPTWRASAEVALALYRKRVETDGIAARYAAAVALVNAQKIEEGAAALRALVAEHPESQYADLARNDLASVEAYLARKRARERTSAPSSPPS